MFFVVFQSKAPGNNSHDYLTNDAKATVVMKIFKQVRTNVHYVAYVFECMDL